MSLFGEKKLYKITWSWGNPYVDSYTEIIAAKDPAHAWKKLCRQHFVSINLISLEELKND